jgi:hypothetical protein
MRRNRKPTQHWPSPQLTPARVSCLATPRRDACQVVRCRVPRGPGAAGVAHHRAALQGLLERVRRGCARRRAEGVRGPPAEGGGEAVLAAWRRHGVAVCRSFETGPRRRRPHPSPPRCPYPQTSTTSPMAWRRGGTATSPLTGSWRQSALARCGAAPGGGRGGRGEGRGGRGTGSARGGRQAGWAKGEMPAAPVGRPPVPTAQCRARFTQSPRPPRAPPLVEVSTLSAQPTLNPHPPMSSRR